MCKPYFLRENKNRRYDRRPIVPSAIAKISRRSYIYGWYPYSCPLSPSHSLNSITSYLFHSRSGSDRERINAYLNLGRAVFQWDISLCCLPARNKQKIRRTNRITRFDTRRTTDHWSPFPLTVRRFLRIFRVAICMSLTTSSSTDNYVISVDLYWPNRNWDTV